MMCAWCLWRLEEGIRSPWTGVMDDSWELNPNSMKEQVHEGAAVSPSLFGDKLFLCRPG